MITNNARYNDSLFTQETKLHEDMPVDECLRVLDDLKAICYEYADMDIFNDALESSDIMTSKIAKQLGPETEIAYNQAVNKLGHSILTFYQWGEYHFANLDYDALKLIIDNLYA